jgi:hypothetical protein
MFGEVEVKHDLADGCDLALHTVRYELIGFFYSNQLASCSDSVKQIPCITYQYSARQTGNFAYATDPHA